MIDRMAPPKKHKKRPATAKAREKAGWKRIVAVTLDAQTIIRLEDIRAANELDSRSDAIRWLAKEEAARMARRERKD